MKSILKRSKHVRFVDGVKRGVRFAPYTVFRPDSSPEDEQDLRVVERRSVMASISKAKPGAAAQVVRDGEFLLETKPLARYGGYVFSYATDDVTIGNSRQNLRFCLELSDVRPATLLGPVIETDPAAPVDRLLEISETVYERQSPAMRAMFSGNEQ